MSAHEGRASAPQTVYRDGTWILFDAARLAAPNADFFDPVRIEAGGHLLGTAPGRGAACFFRAGGREYVLRRYRRGGLAARFSRDRYLWAGLERTRPWREWYLLAWMHARGLPVPRPAAARVRRRGLAYEAELVTQRLPRVWTLADLLHRFELPGDVWQAVGVAIARLHDAGVWHADLNARNILVDDAGAVFLIDFDRSRRRPPGRGWPKANLARLHRSLRKFRDADAAFRFDEAHWGMLCEAHRRVLG